MGRNRKIRAFCYTYNICFVWTYRYIKKFIFVRELYYLSSTAIMKYILTLFVPEELASSMKELGFDKPCLAYYEDGRLHPSVSNVCTILTASDGSKEIQDEYKGYDSNDIAFDGFDPIPASWPVTPAPIWTQVFDWLSEHNLRIHDVYVAPKHSYMSLIYDMQSGNQLWPGFDPTSRHIDLYKTIREGWVVALERALEIIKTKSDAESKEVS